MKILGTANHQDFAGVGVAVPDSLQLHRIQKLKDMGANAWRTAHNCPTSSLLDAADQLGFLVWDENHRNGQDDELKTLVLRDRNHPSIVIWSICNEKLCNTDNTLSDGHRMHDLFHELDPLGQRVVSANYNGWSASEKNTPLDLQGCDYETNNYDTVHAANPTTPLISSETSSAVSDRSIYLNNATAGHVTGYDTEYPSWGQTAEGAWGGVGQTNNQGILTRPYMSGGFTWTGWDYKGEPTPDSWPDVNSHFGILDICGFEKDRYYWYQAWFTHHTAGRDYSGDSSTHTANCTCTYNKTQNTCTGTCPNSQCLPASCPPPYFPCCACSNEKQQQQTISTGSEKGSEKGGQHELAQNSVVHLFPHWNWNKGDAVDVWCFTNGHSVELFVNGISHGRSNSGNYSHGEWKNVSFAPGQIKAIAYDENNQTIGTDTIETTGAAVALRMSIKDGVGANSIRTGCNDVALVMVEVVDGEGRVVPTADNRVAFMATEGKALVYLGGGNGDPAEHTPDKSNTRPAFGGLLLGVYGSTETEGTTTVTASAKGLKSASLDIVSKQGEGDIWWCHEFKVI